MMKINRCASLLLPLLLLWIGVGCGDQEDPQSSFENARDEAVRLRAALEEAIELVQSEHNKALLALNLGVRGDVKGAAQGLQRAVSNLKRAYIDYKAAWDKLTDIAEQYPEMWVKNDGNQLAQADLDIRATADPLIEVSSVSLTELNQLFARPNVNGGGGGGGGGGPSIGGTSIDPDSPAGQLLAELVGEYELVKAEITLPNQPKQTFQPPILECNMTISANGRIVQNWTIQDINVRLAGTITDIKVDEGIMTVNYDGHAIDFKLHFTWDGELFITTLNLLGGFEEIDTWRKL